jgi:hypothetical protein
MSKRPSQCERLLQLLHSRGGEWVPLPEILDLRIGQYNTRIKEIRGSGIEIENKIERDDAGTIHSWYRLVDPPVVATAEPPKPAVEWKDRPRVTGLPLFDLGLQR